MPLCSSATTGWYASSLLPRAHKSGRLSDAGLTLQCSADQLAESLHQDVGMAQRAVLHLMMK